MQLCLVPHETVHLHFPICRYPPLCTHLLDTNSIRDVQTATSWSTDFPRLLQKPGTPKHKSSKGRRTREINARLSKLFDALFPIPCSAYWKGSSSHAPHPAFQTWLPCRNMTDDSILQGNAGEMSLYTLKHLKHQGLPSTKQVKVLLIIYLSI